MTLITKELSSAKKYSRGFISYFSPEVLILCEFSGGANNKSHDFLVLSFCSISNRM